MRACSERTPATFIVDTQPKPNIIVRDLDQVHKQHGLLPRITHCITPVPGCWVHDALYKKTMCHSMNHLDSKTNTHTQTDHTHTGGFMSISCKPFCSDRHSQNDMGVRTSVLSPDIIVLPVTQVFRYTFLVKQWMQPMSSATVSHAISGWWVVGLVFWYLLIPFATHQSFPCSRQKMQKLLFVTCSGTLW